MDKAELTIIENKHMIRESWLWRHHIIFLSDDKFNLNLTVSF